MQGRKEGARRMATINMLGRVGRKKRWWSSWINAFACWLGRVGPLPDQLLSLSFLVCCPSNHLYIDCIIYIGYRYQCLRQIRMACQNVRTLLACRWSWSTALRDGRLIYDGEIVLHEYLAADANMLGVGSLKMWLTNMRIITRRSLNTRVRTMLLAW